MGIPPSSGRGELTQIKRPVSRAGPGTDVVLGPYPDCRAEQELMGMGEERAVALVFLLRLPA